MRPLYVRGLHTLSAFSGFGAHPDPASAHPFSPFRAPFVTLKLQPVGLLLAPYTPKADLWGRKK